MTTVHIMSHANSGYGTGRLRITDLRWKGKQGPEAQRRFYKAFPGCTCKTLEVLKWYDCSQMFHRKNCKWLWYKRKRHPRERHAWTTG